MQVKRIVTNFESAEIEKAAAFFRKLINILTHDRSDNQ